MRFHRSRTVTRGINNRKDDRAPLRRQRNYSAFCQARYLLFILIYPRSIRPSGKGISRFFEQIDGKMSYFFIGKCDGRHTAPVGITIFKYNLIGIHAPLCIKRTVLRKRNYIIFLNLFSAIRCSIPTEKGVSSSQRYREFAKCLTLPHFSRRHWTSSTSVKYDFHPTLFPAWIHNDVGSESIISSLAFLIRNIVLKKKGTGIPPLKYLPRENGNGKHKIFSVSHINRLRSHLCISSIQCNGKFLSYPFCINFHIHAF